MMAPEPAAEAAAPGAPGAPAPEAAAAPPEIGVDHPVGLPNRGNDCFWLSAVQCMRHTPGFPEVLQPAVPGANRPAACLKGALAGLLHAMGRVKVEGLLPIMDRVLEFRAHAMEALPASDEGGKLVQCDSSEQRQQDTHEFMGQLLDYLGASLQPKEPPGSPRRPADPERLEALERDLTAAVAAQAPGRPRECPSGHVMRPWAARAGVCDGCRRSVPGGAQVLDCRRCDYYLCEACHTRDQADRSAREQARQRTRGLLLEYSALKWAASPNRVQSSALGALFEGQQLTAMQCGRCGRFGASGAEPCIFESVRVTADGVKSAADWLAGAADAVGGWFGAPPQRTVRLVELLREAAESPAPEGYRCPDARCGAEGCSARTTCFLRLPATLVLHVNRAEPGGGRCETPLDFDEVLDLNDLRLAGTLGPALDRSLEPCSTRYALCGVIFHVGREVISRTLTTVTHRNGHYYAYILCGGAWQKVDDETVSCASTGPASSPTALELSEPAGGARAALLLYRRMDQGI